MKKLLLPFILFSSICYANDSVDQRITEFYSEQGVKQVTEYNVLDPNYAEEITTTLKSTSGDSELVIKYFPPRNFYLIQFMTHSLPRNTTMVIDGVIFYPDQLIEYISAYYNDITSTSRHFDNLILNSDNIKLSYESGGKHYIHEYNTKYL